MKYLSSILILGLMSCDLSSTDNKETVDSDVVEEFFKHTSPICPIGYHKDSIIEILYGMPTEEAFDQEDSGLIWLGGCELADEQYHCTIHDLSF